MDSEKLSRCCPRCFPDVGRLSSLCSLLSSFIQLNRGVPFPSCLLAVSGDGGGHLGLGLSDHDSISILLLNMTSAGKHLLDGFSQLAHICECKILGCSVCELQKIVRNDQTPLPLATEGERCTVLAGLAQESTVRYIPTQTSAPTVPSVSPDASLV